MNDESQNVFPSKVLAQARGVKAARSPWGPDSNLVAIYLFFGGDKIGIRLKCADSWEGTKESYLSLPGDENKWHSMKRQNSPTKIWQNKRLNLLLTVRYFCFHHVATVSFLLSKTCPFVVSTVIHNYLVVIMLILRPILLDRETVDNWCKIAINKQKNTIELLHNSA